MTDLDDAERAAIARLASIGAEVEALAELAEGLGPMIVPADMPDGERAQLLALADTAIAFLDPGGIEIEDEEHRARAATMRRQLGSLRDRIGGAGASTTVQ